MRNDLQAAVEKLELLSAEHELMANNPGEHPVGKTMLRSRKAAIDTALTALRDAQARQEGCKWCIGTCIDKHVTIPHAPLMHESGGWPVIAVDVPYRFCCNCGRDLAVATAEQSSGVAHFGDVNKIVGGKE